MALFAGTAIAQIPDRVDRLMRRTAGHDGVLAGQRTPYAQGLRDGADAKHQIVVEIQHGSGRGLGRRRQ